MGHIRLSRENDLILVAPASANIIAHTAAGISNDLATTVLLASNKPVFFVPSMNVEMWNNPITQKNIKFLKDNDYNFIGPDSGDLACGETGDGRMSEPSKVYEYIASTIKKKKLKLNILVTAGPTYEAIDPVRYIGNKSSGKQGIEIAKAFHKLGANVSLVLGPCSESIPKDMNTINIETAKDMYREIKKMNKIDVAICAAAVSDWSIDNPSNMKIKKNNNNKPNLNLSLNPDILEYISNKKNNRPRLVIGFAAETENHQKFGLDKLKNKNLDMMSAYSAVSLGHAHPELVKVFRDQSETLSLTSRAFYTNTLGPYLETITKMTGFEMALPMNSGAEAVETAIKSARRWAYRSKKIEPNKAEIIVAEGNFHGRTTTIISFSSESNSKDDFGPHTPGFISVEFGSTKAVEDAITDNTAAVLFLSLIHIS